MVKTKLERVAALESDIPVGHGNKDLLEAFNRCCDVLEAAMPSDKLRRVNCGTSTRLDFNGWRSDCMKIRDMGQRLREGNQTTEDQAVLDSLPADALAVMKLDARGFMDLLKESDDYWEGIFRENQT
jgi:hypothetical protein